MKTSSAFKLFLSSVNGWLSVLGHIFVVFALFSLIVVWFRLGISPVFETLLSFYFGFREIIFWPISQLLEIDIPEHVRDVILIWSVLGGIAMSTLLWVTAFQNRIARETLTKYEDPAAKEAYVTSHGQEKYDAEVEWLDSQVRQTTIPGGLVFGLVTGLFSIISGALAFLYIALVNPNHELLGFSARQFMLIQICAIAASLLVFCTFNFMLVEDTTMLPT